eukprot:Pgem_evm1s7278
MTELKFLNKKKNIVNCTIDKVQYNDINVYGSECLKKCKPQLSCIKTMSNTCVVDSDIQKCQQCQQGYSPDINGQCLENGNNSEYDYTWVIILCCVLGVLIVAGVCVGIWYYHYSKKGKQKDVLKGISAKDFILGGTIHEDPITEEDMNEYSNAIIMANGMKKNKEMPKEANEMKKNKEMPKDDNDEYDCPGANKSAGIAIQYLTIDLEDQDFVPNNTAESEQTTCSEYCQIGENMENGTNVQPPPSKYCQIGADMQVPNNAPIMDDEYCTLQMSNNAITSSAPIIEDEYCAPQINRRSPSTNANPPCTAAPTPIPIIEDEYCAPQLNRRQSTLGKKPKNSNRESVIFEGPPCTPPPTPAPVLIPAPIIEDEYCAPQMSCRQSTLGTKRISNRESVIIEDEYCAPQSLPENANIMEEEYFAPQSVPQQSQLVPQHMLPVPEQVPPPLEAVEDEYFVPNEVKSLPVADDQPVEIEDEYFVPNELK